MSQNCQLWPTGPEESTTILLVGAGHAHLAALVRLKRKLTRSQWEGLARRLVLVSENEKTLYSGVLPEVLARARPESDLWIDVEGFVRRLGVRFVRARLTNVSFESEVATLRFQTTATQESTEVSPRIFSLNIGAGGLLRPWAKLLERIAEIETDSILKTVDIVGGGAAGCELAAALSRRWHGQRRIRLLERFDRLQPQSSPRFGLAWQRWLAELGVEVCLSALSYPVGAKHEIALTGARPPEIFSRFLSVDERLRIKGLGPGVAGFACGDMVRVEGEEGEISRSGARSIQHGVRLAKALLKEELLKEALLKEELLKVVATALGPGRGGALEFRLAPSRRNHLSLQFDGRDGAFARFGSLHLGHGRAWLALKRQIDSAYLQGFRSLDHRRE